MTENFCVPPYSNRGAQNTNESGLRACVDWVQATFLDTSNPYQVVEILGLEKGDFEAVEAGKYGYKYHIRLGHIAIYFSDNRLDVHLEMTGQGCREYEMYNKYDWSVLFDLMLMLPMNFTRLDLAIDDFKGYFKIATLYRKLKSGHARSKFKSFRYMVQSLIAKKEITGQTVYLGSPASMLMIRFYDKLAERKNKNFEIEDGVTFWNRTELQLRDERALAAAVMIAENNLSTGEVVSGILRNYITFCNPTKLKNGQIDKNKSRWKTADFWDKFLGDVQPLALTQKAPDKTVETTLSWFEKNMTATLAMLYEAFEHNPSLLETFLRTGQQNLSKRHLDMLAVYKEQKFFEDYVTRQRKAETKRRLLEPRILSREKILDEREIVEVNKEEYDKRLADLLKDKFIFKIKSDSEQ